MVLEDPVGWFNDQAIRSAVRWNEVTKQARTATLEKGVIHLQHDTYAWHVWLNFDPKVILNGVVRKASEGS